MADIRDYMAAARETDDALRSADTFHGQIEDGARGGANALVAQAILLGLRSVALSIREASVRSDYVTRELGRR